MISYMQGYHFVRVSKICADFLGRCLSQRECAYFYETCLFLSPVLIFEFLTEKIGYCGREDLFFGLHQFLVEKQGFVDVKIFFGLHRFLVEKQGFVDVKIYVWFSPIFSGFTIKSY